MPQKDERLQYDAKARQIVAQMTLEEKITLMSGKTSLLKILSEMINGHGYNYMPYPAGGCERLGVPAH